MPVAPVFSGRPQNLLTATVGRELGHRSGFCGSDFMGVALRDACQRNQILLNFGILQRAPKTPRIRAIRPGKQGWGPEQRLEGGGWEIIATKMLKFITPH